MLGPGLGAHWPGVRGGIPVGDGKGLAPEEPSLAWGWAGAGFLPLSHTAQRLGFLLKSYL